MECMKDLLLFNLRGNLQIIVQRNLICEATTFLLDVLKPNLPEHAFLQTKVENSCHIVSLCVLSIHLPSSYLLDPLSTQVLEINLVTFPNVADAILANGMFSHYDRPRLGHLIDLLVWFQEAKDLWKRIQERQGVNKWRPELEEEYEDREGNIYNKKTCTVLQRRKELRRRKTLTNSFLYSLYVISFELLLLESCLKTLTYCDRVVLMLSHFEIVLRFLYYNVFKLF